MATYEHPNASIIRSAYELMGKGDAIGYAALLDDDVIWHESTPGMQGEYRGRDQVLAFMGQVFVESGLQMSIDVHDVLANDEHAVILHETTGTMGERTLSNKYVDVYHLSNGKITEHWHLSLDPSADEEFFAAG